MKPSRPVLLIGLATAFSLLGDQTLYSVLPTYFRELGLLPYQVGLILSMNRWIRLVTNQLAEWLCRRYNPTVLVGLALMLGALVTLSYGLVPVFPIFIGMRFLWGLSWSFIRQVGLMTVVDSAPEESIGQRMGYYTGISRTGSVAGSLGGALGHDVIGFTMTMLIFSGLSLVGVPLGVLSRRGLAQRHREGSAVVSGRWWDPGFLGCGFVVGCVGTGMVMSTLGLVLEESVGKSVTIWGLTIGVATLTGLLIAGRWMADLLIAPMLGALSDRIGRRAAILLFLGLGALVLLSMAGVVHPVLLAGLVLFFFVCGAGASVTLIAESGTRGSRAVAAYVTSSDVGAAAGPILGWTALQMQFDSGWIYVMGGGLYLIAAAIAWKAFRA
ncbi:MAG: MFS transporter [bacterium]|nr:MFS transporter [bacterium]